MTDEQSESSAALGRMRRGSTDPTPPPAQDGQASASADDAGPLDEPTARPVEGRPVEDAARPAEDAEPPAGDAAATTVQQTTAPSTEAPAEEPAAPTPRPRPRRALGAPGELAPEVIDRHARTLRGVPLPPETAAQRTVREGRRRDLNAAMDTLRGESAPAEQHPRRDLSEILDRLGSPDLARFTAPLAGTVERLLPGESSPERADAARRRREEAEERRRAEREKARRHAAEVARRRAEDEARLARAAAERAQAWENSRAALLEAERAAEAERRGQEQRRQARLRARREREEEKERRRRAAQLARRRRQENRLRERNEAERRRREAAERKERQAREEAQRRDQERERRQHEAVMAATRARIQAERRAREEAELAARERARAAAEAERRRREAEAAAERRRLAEEAARAAAEAERERHRRARRYAAATAEAGLAHARRLEDRRLALAAQQTEEQQQALRAHWERESRALLQVARDLDGPELIPAPQDRPLLAELGEDVSDEELLARARVALPDWRRRGRLATKANAMQAMSAAGAAGTGPGTDGAGSGSGAAPTTASLPLIPGYIPPQGEPEPPQPATAADRLRQLALTGAFALFVLASAWGLGLAARVPGLDALDLGSYRAAQDGRYRAGTTIFSLLPAHVLVWPGLWLVLGLHVLHQWLPGQGGARRQRVTGRSTTLALLALALWFPLAMLVPWGLDCVMWLVALALMVRAIRRLTRLPSRSRGTAAFTDGALGILLGVLLAGAPTVLAAALAAWGVHLDWFPTEFGAVLLMLAVLVVAARLALTGRGRMGLALGTTWPLLCLAIPRLLPSPLGSQQSAWVGFLAVFGGLGLLVIATARRSWVRQLERGALAER